MTLSDVTGLKCDSGSEMMRLVMRGEVVSAVDAPVDAQIRSTLFVSC